MESVAAPISDANLPGDMRVSLALVRWLPLAALVAVGGCKDETPETPGGSSDEGSGTLVALSALVPMLMVLAVAATVAAKG